MMKRFWTWLRTRDEFGDSPIGLAVCALVWVLAISAIFNMPGY